MFVRTKHRIFPSAILTKTQANACDALKRLGGYGIGERDYLRERDALAKRFGHEPGPGDVVWGLFNDLLARHRQLGEQKGIYFMMAFFLLGEGRDPFKVLQQHARLELMDYKASGVAREVKIMADPHGCRECNQQDGKVLTIDDALRLMPVPCSTCTTRMHSDDKYSWCRCMYAPVVRVP